MRSKDWGAPKAPNPRPRVPMKRNVNDVRWTQVSEGQSELNSERQGALMRTLHADINNWSGVWDEHRGPPKYRQQDERVEAMSGKCVFPIKAAATKEVGRGQESF